MFEIEKMLPQKESCGTYVSIGFDYTDADRRRTNQRTYEWKQKGNFR